jgi:anti-anti-sigma regulatory factor
LKSNRLQRPHFGTRVALIHHEKVESAMKGGDEDVSTNAPPDREWRHKGVIRISEIRKGSKRRLLVEGTLSGDWVEVLEKSWLEAQTSRNGEPMRVDLSDVTWIDDKGRELLKRMLKDSAKLRATGIMTRAVIEELIEEIRAQEGSPKL